VTLLGQQRPTTPGAAANGFNQRRSEDFVHRCHKLPYMGITGTDLTLRRCDRSCGADRFQEHCLDGADDNLSIHYHVQLQIRPGVPASLRHRSLPLNSCRYIAQPISSQVRMKKLRRAFLAISLLYWAGAAFGGTVVDATGRRIEVPDHIIRVLPAGPPAAILLIAIAPD
jgi:hypothetical protein